MWDGVQSAMTSQLQPFRAIFAHLPGLRLLFGENRGALA